MTALLRGTRLTLLDEPDPINNNEKTDFLIFSYSSTAFRKHSNYSTELYNKSTRFFGNKQSALASHITF
jgi:hypothetical protein